MSIYLPKETYLLKPAQIQFDIHNMAKTCPIIEQASFKSEQHSALLAKIISCDRLQAVQRSINYSKLQWQLYSPTVTLNDTRRLETGAVCTYVKLLKNSLLVINFANP